MKKTLICILSLTLLSCSMFENETEVESENELKDSIVKSLESLKNKSNNFSIYDGSYLTVSEDSVKSQFLNLPVNIYSVALLDVNEILDLFENQFDISSYISDYYSLSDDDLIDINEKRKVVYQGDLAGFMGYLGKLYGLTLGLDENNLLKVSVYETKTYSLDQFIDGNKSSASLTVGGGEASAGGLNASSETSIESDTWEKIGKYLDDVIGENGYSTILEDFSIVKVTARPWVISDVDKLFNRIKLESQMQVAVQYRVITLSRSKLNQFAINLGLDLTGDNFTVTSEIIDAVIAGGIGISKRSVSSSLDAIVQVISQDVVSEGQFVGLPNRIMPINLTTTTSYISEIEREENANIDRETTSVKTAEIKTGLSMLILPKVLDDGRIQLTSGFTEKKLVSLVTLSGVQLPTIDETETLSTVTIDSGKIELIALYSGNLNNDQNSAQFLGSKLDNKDENKIIAVLIGADSYKLSSTIAKRG